MYIATPILGTYSVVKRLTRDMSKLIFKLAISLQTKAMATYMPEPIPLGSTLGVQFIFVVICNTLDQWLDCMYELLSIESWLFGDIQRKARIFAISTGSVGEQDPSSYSNGTISPVLISAEAAFTLVGVRRFNLPICHRDISCVSSAHLNLYRRPHPLALDTGQVRVYIVIFSPNPSCPLWCAWDGWKLLSRGEFGGIGIPRDLPRSLLFACQQASGLSHFLDDRRCHLDNSTTRVLTQLQNE
jgi:hypothetical protein